MKELQFRVSDVLNEENVSLGDLDEMSISLEKRLTSALEKKKVADKEEFEKIVALENEKRLMRNIEEETKRLEQEAMKNLKMQEFIISRGHVVDMIQENIFCRSRYVKLLKEERMDCKDENEILDIEKSLREAEHREKAGRTDLGIGANMDEPKHDQQCAKVAEETVAEPDHRRRVFFSEIPTHWHNGADEAVENVDRNDLDIFIPKKEPKHLQKNEEVAKAAVKNVSRNGLDIFSKIDEPKYVQKRAGETVDEAGRADLNNLAKMDEPKPMQKRLNGKEDTVEEYLSLTPIIQETISGWDEKEPIPNQFVFRSRKSCIKDNKRIKRSATGAKNKVTKKWIDGEIKEAFAEYEDDDSDRHERLYGFLRR